MTSSPRDRRTAPTDLAPHERRWWQLFGALGTAETPPGLAPRVLAALGADARVREVWGETPRRWLVPVSLAAGLLVAFGVLGFSRAAAEAARLASAQQAEAALPVRQVAVVDDPSVPLFHEMESFGGLPLEAGGR